MEETALQPMESTMMSSRHIRWQDLQPEAMVEEAKRSVAESVAKLVNPIISKRLKEQILDGTRRMPVKKIKSSPNNSQSGKQKRLKNGNLLTRKTFVINRKFRLPVTLKYQKLPRLQLKPLTMKISDKIHAL